MWTQVVFIASLLASNQSTPAPARDPRAQPLTIEDALFTIADVTGRIVPVRDADGDGVADLMIVRGGTRDLAPERIDLVSAKRGTTIRTLTDLGRVPKLSTPGWTGFIGPYAWDGGGDVDHDGVPDLLIGVPTVDDARGRVEVISGKSGETLFMIGGMAAAERFGSAVAFVGDFNGDGRAEFAIGATQLDHSFISRVDGTGMDVQDRVRIHSPEPGFVSVRNGRDATQLCRTKGTAPGQGFGRHLQRLGNWNGDGRDEFLARNDWQLTNAEPFAGVLNFDCTTLWNVPPRRAQFRSAGDFDLDGTPDLLLETSKEDGRRNVDVVSGKTGEMLDRFVYPDLWGDFNVVVPLGDLDEDGRIELAFCGTNINLAGPDQFVFDPKFRIDLRTSSLAEALACESQPQSVGDRESGCVLVYSGRSHKVLFGVWGMPGTARGLGYEVAPLPDVNADGHLDLIIADSETAYVFAGPGPRKK